MSRWRWIVLAVLTVVGATWPLLSSAQRPARPATSAPAATAPRGAPTAAPAPASVAAGHEKAGEGAEEDHPPGAINWANGPYLGSSQPPFVATIVNFAFLLFIYYYFGKKPITEALKARRASVAKEIEDAQRMKQEAEARAKQYQSKLATLEDELASARQALVDAGRGEKEHIVKEAEEKAARMQKDAELLIEQEMKQIRQDLWRETVQLAVGTAEELLKKRITPADQERIADDYLADLVGKPRAGASGSASIRPPGGAS